MDLFGGNISFFSLPENTHYSSLFTSFVLGSAFHSVGAVKIESP